MNFMDLLLSFRSDPHLVISAPALKLVMKLMGPILRREKPGGLM
jgi:hypothetical protein